jgi:hypothetical protein
MAISATCLDDANTVHLLIGLNREDVESLLLGEVLTVPPGRVPLSEDSTVALVLAETDDDLVRNRLPSQMPTS